MHNKIIERSLGIINTKCLVFVYRYDELWYSNLYNVMPSACNFLVFAVLPVLLSDFIIYDKGIKTTC
jgi:hypothetical protein